MPSTSTLLTVVGALAFVCGLVGHTVFGWQFGGERHPVALAIALGCVAVALLSFVRES
ncbi:hypothetical protein [Halomarina litorea]|uniref:hypothetical protein n=1 Tax=Halomarina litorea TaxID=2961595 RepID=UPI0020C4BD73|nr:hypothetical protein [Halomarina sp. BCD28]